MVSNMIAGAEQGSYKFCMAVSITSVTVVIPITRTLILVATFDLYYSIPHRALKFLDEKP